jgi:hypothetical protein
MGRHSGVAFGLFAVLTGVLVIANIQLADPGHAGEPDSHARYFLLDASTSDVNVGDLREAGYRIGGQLAGDHSLIPNGFVAYLYPDEVRQLRSLDLFVMDLDQLPEEFVPISEDLLCPLNQAEAEVVHEGRFCAYSGGPSDTCETTISEELLQLDASLSDDFFELIDTGTTLSGETIWAARMGNLTESDALSTRIPQVVIIAAQHAREWIAPEAAMGIIRHFAEGNAPNLLDNAAITVMPVNNPDGYNFSFTNARFWRANLFQCDNGNRGVDPNRNHPFSWDQPGNSDNCAAGDNTIFRGLSAGSEAETQAARDLIAVTDAPSRFETVVVVSIHSFGNLVLYSDGFSEDFAPCTTNSNCTNPDLGALSLLGGTNAKPKFHSERGIPFRPGQDYRNLIVVGGDVIADAHFGDLPQSASNALGLTVELGDAVCGFEAEFFSNDQFQKIINQQINYAEFLLDTAPKLSDGSLFDEQIGPFSHPHIHRRLPETEHPTLRFGARLDIPDVTAPKIAEGAELFRDNVLEGVVYRGWALRPGGDPFSYPREIEICAGQLLQCRQLVIGERGSTETEHDFCSPGYFSIFSGWEFVGKEGDGITPTNQCFWSRDTNARGNGPWILESSGGSLAGMESSSLVFSYFHGNQNIDLTVLATSTDFSNCDYDVGDCRIAFDSRADGIVGLLLFDDDFIFDPGFRTEILDLSDFDGKEIRIRFELRGDSPQVGIYDPIVMGWQR